MGERPTYSTVIVWMQREGKSKLYALNIAFSNNIECLLWVESSRSKGAGRLKNLSLKKQKTFLVVSTKYN